MNFDIAQLHGSMLDDRRRTTAFIERIEAVVTPGDVVVEIGTGTGVLSVAAVRAGADCVFAIEPGPVARYAQMIFEANDVADRIVLIERWSHEVVLPQRCDVLIAELVGHDPVAEQIISTIRDAGQRFLKRRARLIPSGMKLFCVPVTISTSSTDSGVFTQSRLQSWSSWYAMDLSPLARAMSADGDLDFAESRDVERWSILGPPVLVEHCDFRHATGPAQPVAHRVELTADGRLDGFAFFFELLEDDEVFLSTSLSEVDEANHWRVPIWTLPTPVTVRETDAWSLEFWREGPHRMPRCRLLERGSNHFAESRPGSSKPALRMVRHTSPPA